ncbi:MAG: efflux RND transporter periplasmic adaptor subunit [Saprospiraceae bacterium]
MNLIKKISCTVLISSLMITSCNSKKKDIEATGVMPVIKVADEVILSNSQFKVADIQTGKIEMRSLSNLIKVNGILDVPPQNVVSISAPLGGYLRTSGLLPGKAIYKGQMLATIENPEFIDIQQEYLESEGKLEFLELEYTRQEELRKKDVNAAKTFQQISSDLKVMKAKIMGLEQKLALININKNTVQSGIISRTTNLYSPISGYITASNINKGRYVSPTDVLFEIVNKDDILLALNVFEKDVMKIKVGQTIRFSLANETEYNRKARVFLIGKEKGSDGTIPVRSHLEKINDASLLPGMYAKALIETTNNSVAALPVATFIQSEGNDFIFVQTKQDNDGYTFKMIPIKKGVEENGYVEVNFPDGFDSNASQIVVKGAYSLLSAMKNVEE